MDPLDRATGGLEVAGTGRANRNPSHIGPRFVAARWDHRPHQVTGPEATHNIGRLWRLIGEAKTIGAAHLPAVSSLRRDEQGNDPGGVQHTRRARTHARRIQPMGLGQASSRPVVLGSAA